MRIITPTIFVVALVFCAAGITGCDEEESEPEQNDRYEDLGDEGRLVGEDDEDEDDTTSDDPLERTAAAYADVIRASLRLDYEGYRTHCECEVEAGERDDVDDCVEDMGFEREAIDEVGDCVEEAILAEMDPPPPGVDETLECEAEVVAEQRACIEEVERTADDVCDDELTMDRIECSRQARDGYEDCEDYLDAAGEQWFDEANEAIEADDCYEPIRLF